MHPYHAHKQHKVERSRVSRLTKGYAGGGAVKGLVKKVLSAHKAEHEALHAEGKESKHRMDRPHRAKGGRVGKPKKNAATIVNVITGGHPGGGAAPPPMAPPMGAGIAPAAMPPPMAAKPPMMPPPGASGPPPGMPLRAKGGRINRDDGGTVFPGGRDDPYRAARPPNQSLRDAATRGVKDYDGPTTRNHAAPIQKAKGGAVKSKGMHVGTPVQHDTGKNDLADMNRKRVVSFQTGGGVRTFMAGGRVESPDGVAKATRLPGGGGGGEARLAKAHRAERKG